MPTGTVRRRRRTGERRGAPMVVGASVGELLAITNAKFGPEFDFTSIARVTEDWAGVQIRG